MKIEQATPEQQANLDGMEIHELEALVASEEGAAPGVEGQATAQPQGESVGKTENEAPKADEPPKYFKDFAEQIKRELGSYRSLTSLKDQIPQMVQKEAQRQLAALKQAERNANLSPEDQEAQEQLQAQQEEWQKFVDERADARAKAQLDALAGEYGPILTELKEQRADARLKDAVSSLVKDVVPDFNDEKFASLFEGLAEKIEAGDQAALQRFERLTTQPEYAALELIKAQRGKVQQQAEQVNSQRDKMARAAAQTPKGSVTNANQGKKSVAEMNQAELDKLSIAELEAALPEA
jgi:hypothetical protein